MTQPGDATDPFSLVSLAKCRHPTPFLLIDLARVERAYRNFTQLLPGVRVHYAMKCNPDSRILRRLAAAGCSYEVASYAELAALQQIGVNLHEVLFSNPVKMIKDIRGAFGAGLRRFSYDSVGELAKLAEYAPGSQIYVRLRVDSSKSIVASEGKFGVDSVQAFDLLRSAVRSGLEPYGLAFHVGSQTRQPQAWDNAIKQSALLMQELQTIGLRIKTLNMGGGFPAHYQNKVPSLQTFASHIRTSLKKHLPYEVDLLIEPGRALVGDAGVMVATVIGLAERSGKTWIHLDVGAFNGMMEALETQNALRFPVSDSKMSTKKSRYHLTGPSCDSQDTILYDVSLSEDLSVGDRVCLYTAGAYTTSYASTFNGFVIPKTYCTNE